jgi:cell division protease FtsH
MKNNPMLRNFVVWFAVFAVMMMVFEYIAGSTVGSNKLAFSDFLQQVEGGNVTEVVIKGEVVEGKLADGKKFSTLAPANYSGLVDKMTQQHVKFEVISTESAMGTFMGVMLSWFPLLLLLGVWMFFMRQMQGGAGKAMGFGKSRAKLLLDKHNAVTFMDVAGIDESKAELAEIVDFLRDPGKYQKLGGKIPKGCLLIGSPGTGKTLLARAIAGEAKVPFFSISGSDFVEMFVGVGASRVRDMFEQAKKHAPCIIFIDEIDAVGRHRGAGLGGGNDEREQTLNQLLVEMDGFTTNQGVIVVAATNRPDVLDPALLRPGRFDRQIVVPAPDINGREAILKVHSTKIAMAPDVDLRLIARGTPGFSGADLANLVNEAALLAARKNRNLVTMQELDDAKDKVMMGAERRSRAMSEDERKLTAYHEAGHAIVSLNMPGCYPIHKATIIPRGMALGMVLSLPERDSFSVTKEKLLSDIAMAMGGRVAEEIIFGIEHVTTGASSDIKQATSSARKMVTQWGMSDKIGPVLVSDEQEEVFLGHSIGKGENKRSDELASIIDQEVKRIVQYGYDEARRILTERNQDLKLLAEALLEHETLTGGEIKQLLADGKIDKGVNNEVSVPVETPSKVVKSAKKSKKNSGE